MLAVPTTRSVVVVAVPGRYRIHARGLFGVVLVASEQEYGNSSGSDFTAVSEGICRLMDKKRKHPKHVLRSLWKELLLWVTVATCFILLGGYVMMMVELPNELDEARAIDVSRERLSITVKLLDAGNYTGLSAMRAKWIREDMADRGEYEVEMEGVEGDGDQMVDMEEIVDMLVKEALESGDAEPLDAEYEKDQDVTWTFPLVT